MEQRSSDQNRQQISSPEEDVNFPEGGTGDSPETGPEERVPLYKMWRKLRPAPRIELMRRTELLFWESGIFGGPDLSVPLSGLSSNEDGVREWMNRHKAEADILDNGLMQAEVRVRFAANKLREARVRQLIRKASESSD